MQTALPLAKHLSRTDLANLLELVEQSGSAGTEAQFRVLARKASSLIPLQRMHACFAALDGHSSVTGFSHHIAIDFPMEFVDAYVERGYAGVDRVWGELVRAGRPVIWHRFRQRFRSEIQLGIYALARDHGLLDGFSFGARSAYSPRFSVFSAVCDRGELARHARHLAIVDYLTPYLHSVLSRIQFGLLKEAPPLTERECQVMGWAKFGKTDFEISLQMGISARTVKFHVENVIHKLHANNRLQAAAIALSQGLIHW